ncbi:hypothetical protein [Parvularcula sp. IMCC14364]|uniref:hypothetical protein n=1 Tax=Parvularcula sp. IMCC14364 TaxID=3067902 RepID=UPI002741469B|nr:hypothetical protein [Parvularcula sp. IMCC14364]
MTAFQLLVVFSVVSISLMAFLLHRLGQSTNHAFTDGAAAGSVFLEEFPDSRVDKVALSGDGRAAMLTLANEPYIGLVRAMGKFSLARKVGPQSVRSVEVHETTVKLKLRDFADPDFSITFSETKEAERWAGYFGPLEEQETHA